VQRRQFLQLCSTVPLLTLPKSNLIPTGHPDLDKLLKGGLPPGSVNLLYGLKNNVRQFFKSIKKHHPRMWYLFIDELLDYPDKFDLFVSNFPDKDNALLMCYNAEKGKLEYLRRNFNWYKTIGIVPGSEKIVIN
jgi:hypothetical protein